MANVRAEVPGLATALKPGLGSGIFALMELSVTRFGQPQQPRYQSTPSLAEDQVNNSPQTNEAIRPSLDNAQSASMDSGFNDFDGIANTANFSPDPSRQLSKTNSRSSLSSTVETKSSTKNERKWKTLQRSETRPHLQYGNSTVRPPLQNLLMEAILILREAEEKGTWTGTNLKTRTDN